MSTTAYHIIAVDFDGTLCYSNWPELGEPNRPLIEYLIRQKRSGSILILWTCRAGEALEKAVSWCREHQLEFDAMLFNIVLQDADSIFSINTLIVLSYCDCVNDRVILVFPS